MASRKEYEMLFRLNAQMGGSYSNTFKSAQREIVIMQKEIDLLSKTQSDISSYQKQQSAVEATRQKLSVLQQQYDNIQKEISETSEFSADLQNKLLAKQLQIDKTSSSLETATQRLDQMGESLKKAGVNTDELSKKDVELGAQIDTIRQKQEDAANQAESFGTKASQAFAVVQQALVAAGIAKALQEIYQYLGSCIDASMEFESAMTGVAKTTDFSNEELAQMSENIKELSTEIPVTTTELAAIEETAGQLGIAKDNLLSFTEVMAELGTATNMTSDEAATMLAQFASITGMDPSYYDELGSTIVDLGNSYATTERNISEMSQTIAAAGSIAGMSEADIVGVSAAVTSLGISAQNGATQMSKLISDINSAVSSGEGLNDWASAAGMSASDFADSWGTDAADALDLFIRGLNETYQAGGDVYGVLTDLGITETRMVTMITSLAKSGTQLTDTLQTANAAWSENTALTTEAEKRYGTTESQLALMQNAYGNLKVAVGDQFTPELRKLYELGTKVFNGMADFVDEHPAVVKAITLIAAEAGTILAVATTYNAIKKVSNTLKAIGTAAAAAETAAVGAEAIATTGATAATVAFNAALNINPIVLAITAVAGLTAGMIALTSSTDESAPSVKELTEAARAMSDTMDEAADTYDETVTATLAAAGVADIYIGKLEDMEAAGLSTDEQHRQYHNTLALLCQVVPELADNINLETDTINGGTDALRANTEAWKKNAMQQAYQDQLTELYKSYSAVLIEAEENSIGLTKAQYELDAANKKQNDSIAQMDKLWAKAVEQADAQAKEFGTMADATYFLTQEYYDLQNSLYGVNDEIWAAERSMKTYQTAIGDDGEATAEAKEQIDLAAEAVNNLMEATGEGAEAAAEAAQQEQALQGSIAEVTAKITTLTESYNEAYEAAFGSINGQYDLWDKVAAPVATAAGAINSALESQITYWQDYNSNLQALTDRSADIEGLSDVIASFADGSKDSVNAIAGMASASDSDLRDMIDNWSRLQEEQQTTSESLAQMVEAFPQKMAEYQAELETAIGGMNLSEEAAESGKATIQGFIDSAVDLLPQVQAAYARVANAAQAALSTGVIGTASGISGYAVGTQSAAPGFALVGEHGPELVYFGGGEQVMTAEETAAMKDGFSASELQAVTFAPKLMEYLSAASADNAISAESGRGASGGSSVMAPVFNVTYNVAGAAGDDVISDLEKHNGELRAFVLDVMEEDRIDAERRAYR